MYYIVLCIFKYFVISIVLFRLLFKRYIRDLVSPFFPYQTGKMKMMYTFFDSSTYNKYLLFIY